MAWRARSAPSLACRCGGEADFPCAGHHQAWAGYRQGRRWGWGEWRRQRHRGIVVKQADIGSIGIEAGHPAPEVIALLSRKGGAGIEELIAATGWLPHTTRAALTGLRKRGYAIARERAGKGEASIYRIVNGPAHAKAA